MQIIAERIAMSMKKAVPDRTASVEVLKFGLVTLISNVSVVLLAIIFGLFIGMLKETVLTILTVALLRFIIGGIHFRSMLVCMLVSVVVLTILPLIPINNTWIVILTVLSVLIILVFAPSNIANKTRIPEKHFRLLKFSAAIIVSLNFFFLSGIFAKGCFTASLGIVKFRRRGRGV
ncbi:accessory regulator AgrB [Xylanibacillus composti]|uniref:Accessory gene regulator B n=1 Tax=Xylanibacillus composti TaxID=1572762 RepID=A0A8J4H568_9BACL|nr:accessory gene regulator B family protein [Xylanibacillus composti]MDT9725703.1 accessory regulator AgrB [Xylanibacillus composti]GIQ71158.1 hypothetical protein XYCOK13_39820 [Xylanibacillus composti]